LESLVKFDSTPIFQTPSNYYITNRTVLQNTVRPPWWQKDVCRLGANTPGVGVGFENVDFMIWMQTAALPNFRKLYRILDRDASLFIILPHFTISPLFLVFSCSIFSTV
ncbi:hypothetical protein OESDEN_19308, partial [Oesophagostomum dentatum]